MAELKIMDSGKPFVKTETSETFAPMLLSVNPCAATNYFALSYNTDNGQDGIMFDVVATKNITITCFEDNFQVGTWDIEIWVKAGTCVGFENNAAAWSLIGSANNVVSSGLDLPTYIPISVNYPILAGQIVAFYITAVAGFPTAYTNGSFVPGVIFDSNADLSVTEGYGKEYPFGATFDPRRFNGTIYYNENNYTPNESLVVVNQALNADLVSIGNTPHIIVWNLIKNSFQWVNTLTNYIDKELFGNNTQTQYVTTPVAALSQADLATPAYTNMLIGSFISITDYNVTGDGTTLQKVSIDNLNYLDWIIISTENFLSTGKTGESPI